MIQNFEIMKVIDHHNRGQFIFARQLNVGQDFDIKEGSILDGITVYHYLDMPRMIDESGRQRLDVLVFRPVNRFATDHFKQGQLVELIVPD